MKIELCYSKKNGFYWLHLCARNGEIILVSEQYANRSNAIRAGNQLSESMGLPFYKNGKK